MVTLLPPQFRSLILRTIPVLCLFMLSALFIYRGAALAAPTVTATSPAVGTTGVPASATVRATFSEAMDPATITSGTVTLEHVVGIKAIAAGGNHTVALKNDGTVVAWGG